MNESVWESAYFDAYDKVLLNSEIYTKVRDFHIAAMRGRKTILDSGAGTGNVTMELLKANHIVYAIDNSKKALEILKNKCHNLKENLRIENTDAKTTPFTENTFDGITSMFVMQYIESPEKYLKENYRVLKPDGIFALTGRTDKIKMREIPDSYEQSLIKKRKMKELETEFHIFKEKFQNNVTKAVINTHAFEEIKKILTDIGFIDIKEHPNPYFGQCYSLTAKK